MFRVMISFGVLGTLLACGEKTVSAPDEEVIDQDGDGVEAELDCNDSNDVLGAMADDLDCDGFVNSEDCAPEDAAINPDAEDTWYDGIDSNCDGADDYDQDGDGEASNDYDGSDCNDLDSTISSGATEIWYDDIDQNCDGLSDFDQDGDGEDSIDYGGVDCDDIDATVNTVATEVWYDGVDQNCDGLNDYDQDGDGEDTNDHGGTDCDDIDRTINSVATEVWYDGVDQDCNGLSDYDQDGDGEDSVDYGGTDCEDLDSTINSGATEVWYDGVDQNCDGLSDFDQDGDGEDSVDYSGSDCDDADSTTVGDDDGDGFYACVDDCDDLNADVHPNATEYCDGIDYDCDGEGYQPGVVSYVDNAGNYVNYTINQTQGSAVGNVNLTNVPNSSGEWHFCEGTYYETYELAPSNLTASVSIEGHGSVVLSGNETAPIFVLEIGGVTLDITGVTIRDGYNDSFAILEADGTLNAGAGGIFCDPQVNTNYRTYVNIDTVSFLFNEGDAGGALTVGEDCTVDMQSSVMEDNSASYGGAIFSMSEYPLTISDSYIQFNTATTRGGAIHLESNPIAWYAPISGYSTLASNVQASSRTTAYLDNVFLYGNSSGTYGGAIDTLGASVHIDSSSILNNTATYGGAVYQRASQNSMFDTNIASNSAAFGGAIRLFQSSSVIDSSNIFSCASITGSATISGNTTSNSQSAAIFISGDDAEVRMKQCKPGGNLGSNSDPDLKMASGGSLSFSATSQVSAIYTASEVLNGELCTPNSYDLNGNGLTGWDEPFCNVEMGHAYSSQNLRNNLFSLDPTCYNNGTYNYNDAVADAGSMNWSGCLRNTVRTSQNESFVMEIYDDQQQSLTCAEGGLGLNGYVETEVSKDEGYWLAASFDANSVSSFVLQGNVKYGYDCDGNCCYDVYMTDSYDDGLGWNGAQVQVLQGQTVVDTFALTSSTSGWDSFCVDSGQSFSLVWDTSNQTPFLDYETFVVKQGNDLNGDTLCSVNNPSAGLQSSCGSNGIMTCQ